MAGKSLLTLACGLVGAVLVVAIPHGTPTARAQAQTTSTLQANQAETLDDEEMEVLVARIALYPDELVAAIVAASIYPIQIVQAQRYLDLAKTTPGLKPVNDWDGSVVALLNYPQIVKMMNDDLDWTQALGDAVTNQEKDLLEAIQQLRAKAMAKGILKSDDKAAVVRENDTVSIQPAKASEIYIPNYEPQALYEPGYPAAPMSYYPDYYPSYYDPVAPYFPGFVTGAIWGAAIDWNNWGVWGGGGSWGNDVNIGCNNCFNNRNFNGNMNFNDVDWKNVDRSKISFDKNQLNNLNSNRIKNDLQRNDRNNVRNQADAIRQNRPSANQNRQSATGPDNRQVKDVRKSTLEGLKKQAGNATARQGNRAAQQPARASQPARAAADRSSRPSSAKGNRPGKAKPGARADTRPRNPSPMGDINRGQNSRNYSNRGGRSMGGGYNRGGGAPRYAYHHGGGRGYGGGGYGGGRGGGFGGGRGGGRGGRR